MLGCPLSPLATHAGIPASQHPYFNSLLAPNYHPHLAPRSPTARASTSSAREPRAPRARPRVRPRPRPRRCRRACARRVRRRAPRRGSLSRVWEVKPAPPAANADAAADADADGVLEPTISEYTIHPSDFGLPVHHLSPVAGGSPADNLAYLTALLSIHLTPDFIQSICDYVLLNAAALLVVSGLAEDWKEASTRRGRGMRLPILKFLIVASCRLQYYYEQVKPPTILGGWVASRKGQGVHP